MWGRGPGGGSFLICLTVCWLTGRILSVAQTSIHSPARLVHYTLYSRCENLHKILKNIFFKFAKFIVLEELYIYTQRWDIFRINFFFVQCVVFVYSLCYMYVQYTCFALQCIFLFTAYMYNVYVYCTVIYCTSTLHCKSIVRMHSQLQGLFEYAISYEVYINNIEKLIQRHFTIMTYELFSSFKTFCSRIS